VTLIGELSLWIALLMATWGAAVSFAGGALERRDLAASGRRAIYVAFAALALATAGVIGALVRRDFSLAYVALHTDLALPRPQAVAALWSGPAGTLLLCALVFAGCATFLARGGTRPNRPCRPWTAGVSATLLLFVLLVVCLQANPYERVAWQAPDGQGLDPRLLQPALVLQGPLLVLGYVALNMPFVVTMGGLLAHRLDAAWVVSARRWTLAGWTCLSAGVLLGARGGAATSPTGAWSWSANGAAVAAVWIIATGLLHALGAAPQRGPAIRWISALAATVAVGSLVGAYTLVATGGGPTSGAAWVGAGAVCAGAAIWVMASRTPTATVESVAPVAPRRRSGEHLTHAAAAVLAIAITAGSFPAVHDVTLAAGQEAQIADPFGHVWKFVSQGMSRYGTNDHDVVAVPVEGSRDGGRAGLLVAQQWQYRDAQGDSVYAPVTRVGVQRSVTLDTRVALIATSDDQARLRITFVPLAVWVWIGGVGLVVGGMLAAWPRTSGGSGT
jgi:cytochrome c-type biogenesis protein CcmF